MQRNLLSLFALSCAVGGCFEPSPNDVDPSAETETEAQVETDTDVGSTGAEPDPTNPDDSTSTSGSSGGPVTTATSGPSDESTGEDEEDIEFFDDFDADDGQWRFEDDAGARKEGPGMWRYGGGDLIQDSDISGPETASPSLGTYALGGDFDWDAYLVETAYTADDDGVAGLVCHVTESGDFIRFDLDHETGIVRLVRRQGGVLSLLEEVEVFEVPMELEVERTLTLECGDTYRGFVDGMLVIEGGESHDAEGGVGMYASSIGDGPSGLRFHRISVSDD